MNGETPKRLAPKLDTLIRLFAKSGNQCAFPGCEAHLIDDENNFIGQVCHIEGVKGERFNETMSNEERRDYDNLIIFCYPHHKKTNNEAKFSVELLKELKRKHESIFQNENLINENAVRNIYDDFKSHLESIKDETIEINAKVQLNTEYLEKIISHMEKDKSTEEGEDNFIREIDVIEKLRSTNNHLSAISKLKELRDEKWDKLTKIEKYKVLANLGISYLGIDENELAAQYFIDAVQYDLENYKSLAFASVGYAIQENADKSKEYFQKAIALQPDNPFAYVSMIMLSKSVKDIDELLVQIPPTLLDKAEVSYALGMFEKSKGKYESAINWLHRSLDTIGNDKAQVKATIAAIIIESLIDQFKLLSGQITANEKNKIAYAINLLDEAWDEVKHTELKENSSWFLVDRGTAKRLIGDINGSYQDTLLAYEITPNLEIAITNLMVIAFENGNIDQAFELIDKWKNLDKDGMKSDVFKAEIYYKLKKYNEAIEILTVALEHPLNDSTKDLAQHLLIDCYLHINRDLAVDLCENIVSKQPDRIQGYIYAGKVYRELGEKSKALSYLDRAYAIINDTTLRVDLLGLFQELFELGDYNKSVVILEKITNPEVYSNLNKALLKCYYKLGDIGRALAICSKLTEIYGPVAFVTDLQSFIYQSIDDIPNAIAVCKEHIAIYPDDYDIVFNLALAYSRIKDWDNVQEILGKYIINIDELAIESTFQLARMHIIVGNVERGLDIAYTKRKANINNGLVHKYYVTLIEHTIHEINSIYEIGTANINTKVYLQSTFDNNEISFLILARNSDLSNGEISMNSFLAKQLLGRKIGDVVGIEAEGKTAQDYIITKIVTKYKSAGEESALLLDTLYLEYRPYEKYISRKTGDVKTDMKFLFERIDSIQNFDNNLIALYLTQSLTIGGCAYRTGLNEIKVWAKFYTDTSIGIFSDYCYPQEVADNILKKLGEGNSIVIDLISILTASSIDSLSYFNEIKNRKIVSRSTLDIIDELILELRRIVHEEVTSIVKVKDEYYKNEISSSELQKSLEHFEKLFEWISTNCEVLPVNEALKINLQEKLMMGNVLGKASIDSILIAKEHGFLLLADEGCIRSIASNDYKVESLSSYLLLLYYRKQRLTTEEKHTEQVSALICRNYKYLPVNVNCLIKCLEYSNNKVAFPFTLAIQSLHPVSTEDSAIKVALSFLYILYNRRDTNFENILVAVLNCLIQGRSPDIIFGKLKAAINLNYSRQPLERDRLLRPIITYFLKIMPDRLI